MRARWPFGKPDGSFAGGLAARVRRAPRCGALSDSPGDGTGRDSRAVHPDRETFYPSNQLRIVSINELLTVYGESQLHMLRSRSYMNMPQRTSRIAQKANRTMFHAV